jgi:hypothetical protein
VVVRKPPNTWYVSAYIPDKEKTGYYSRRSQSFTSESDAKKFAAAELAAGVEVSAGTINPVVPKRIVGPSQIRKSTVKNVFRADLGEAWRQEGASQDQQQGAQ